MNGLLENVNKIGSPICLTHEQFRKVMEPTICEVCRRVFNPTDEEREKDRLALEEIDKSIFEWEVILNHEANQTSF